MGGAAAGSSQDVRQEDAKNFDTKKNGATETREVREEPEVDGQTTRTPRPRPKTSWPTPKEGNWWLSSPLRQWYDEDQSSEVSWWTSAWNQQRRPFQNGWNCAREERWS